MWKFKSKVGAALTAGLITCFLSYAGSTPAQAGCGEANPNCIVPTAPLGTSNNQAASTQFVQRAVAAGGNLPLPNAEIYVGNAGNVAAPVSPSGSGDCTFTFTNLGVFGFTCLKTSGVAFAPSATTDTTNASNIGSGTLAAARLPAGVYVTSASNFAVNHTIATTDCGTVVQMGTGSTWPLTLTLPSVFGFTGPCPITIAGQASRGVKLSGFSSLGLTSPNILWPTKTFSIAIVNAAWALTAADDRWASQNLTFFVDNAGADSNDGLGTGSQAFQTLVHCAQSALLYIDTQSAGNGGVTCSPPAGQTFQEFVQVFFPMVGGGTLIFSGNGGPFTWKPPTSSFSLQVGDLGVAGLTNVTFSSAGVTTPQGFIVGHNYGVLDVNAGVSFLPTVAIPNLFSCDFDTHINVNNGIGVGAGSITGSMFNFCQGSSWNINGAEAFTGTPTIGKWGSLFSGAKVTVQGNVSFTGSVTASGVSTVSGNSVLNNLSGATLPGGTPTPSTGGQYCTTQC